jgi:hypothetical protein
VSYAVAPRHPYALFARVPPFPIALSEEATRVLEREEGVRAHYASPITRACAPTLVEMFERLVGQWMRDTGAVSSITEIALHPSYQRIIGLGPDVVPLILGELSRRPNHWFWALKALTGEDPVPPASRGRIREMTTAWLAWGREQRLLP